jgi:hypothetical protein
MLLELIADENKYCVICGDMNIDALGGSNNMCILSDMLLSYNMCNSNLEPTRVQGNSSTCLDHCYSNISDNLSISINKNFISDHYGIEIAQSCTESHFEQKSQIFKRKYLTNTIAISLMASLDEENGMTCLVVITQRINILHFT